MVQMLVIIVKCPKCKQKVNIPFFKNKSEKDEITTVTEHKCKVNWEKIIKNEIKKLKGQRK